MASSGERTNGDGAKEVQPLVSEKFKDGAVRDPGTNIPRPSSPSPGRLRRSSTTPQLSAPPSIASSPKPSREGSPTRPLLKSGASTGNRPTTRSRKNSQDLSPIRGSSTSGASIPTVPSAAAIQRALSAAGTPHLSSPGTPDFHLDTPRPQKKSLSGGSPQPGPGLLNSKSPPPLTPSSKSILSSARRLDQHQSQSTPTTPTIVVDRPPRNFTVAAETDAAEEDHPPRSGMRTPSRGISINGPVLETVQESSLPATPAISGGRSGSISRTNPNDRPEPIEENPLEESLGKENSSRNESGSESAGNKSGGGKNADESRPVRKSGVAANSAKPPTIQSKKSFTQLPFTKAKTASEGSVKNMTVETETVSSIPQVALGGGAVERNNLGRTETSGSLRLKPSTETIRPKKEKKKIVRKAPSLNAGTGMYSFSSFFMGVP